MSRIRFVAVLAAFSGLISVTLTAPAWADSDRHDRGDHKEWKEKHKEKEKKREKSRSHGFREDDRLIVRDFYSRNPSSLPPGLAKRGGNLPPGLARRDGNLPPGLSRDQVVTPELRVHLLPLPRELELKLPPPPHEVIRQVMGRDLVLIHKHTHKVLDVLHDALP